jgi:hypothetical protein
MGVNVGLKGFADLPLPKFEPGRVTVDELVASDKSN